MFSYKNRRDFNRPMLRPLWLMTSTRHWACFTNVSMALNILLKNVCIAEIKLLLRIRSWILVRMPKAWLWTHVPQIFKVNGFFSGILYFRKVILVLSACTVSSLEGFPWAQINVGIIAQRITGVLELSYCIPPSHTTATPTPPPSHPARTPTNNNKIN